MRTSGQEGLKTNFFLEFSKRFYITNKANDKTYRNLKDGIDTIRNYEKKNKNYLYDGPRGKKL